MLKNKIQKNDFITTYLATSQIQHNVTFDFSDEMATK